MLLLYPDNKVHGTKMGPIWDQQNPGGRHVDHMNFTIWVGLWFTIYSYHNVSTLWYVIVYSLQSSQHNHYMCYYHQS